MIRCPYPEDPPLKEGWFRIGVEDHIKDWLEEANIKYSFSHQEGAILFQNEEDRVKFILRWL